MRKNVTGGVSDIVVSTFSTILIDAIAFKKLRILVKFGSETPFPFNESDVSLNVNLTTLENAIKEITCNLDLQNTDTSACFLQP